GRELRVHQTAFANRGHGEPAEERVDDIRARVLLISRIGYRHRLLGLAGAERADQAANRSNGVEDGVCKPAEARRWRLAADQFRVVPELERVDRATRQRPALEQAVLRFVILEHRLVL